MNTMHLINYAAAEVYLNLYIHITPTNTVFIDMYAIFIFIFIPKNIKTVT